MIFLLANWRWALPVALLAISLAWGGWNHVALTNLRAANARATLAATESARAQEARHAALATQIEVAHHERSQAIDEAYAANRKLIAANGLRFRTSQCVPKPATGTGSIADGTTEVRLPGQIESDLLDLAHDADRAAAYAQAGHDWAMKLKGSAP